MLCAQCYPRHACPLYVSLFKQLHAQTQAASALAMFVLLVRIFCMQIHAVLACITIYTRHRTENL